MIFVKPTIVFTILICVWLIFASQCWKCYRCLCKISCWVIFHCSSIYRFINWMSSMDSTKALEPFFVISTKLLWITIFSLLTHVLLMWCPLDGVLFAVWLPTLLWRFCTYTTCMVVNFQWTMFFLSNSRHARRMLKGWFLKLHSFFFCHIVAHVKCSKKVR
jgi:hypothetical protein